MTEEEAIAIRQIYRENFPAMETFWQEIGREAHRAIETMLIVRYDPQRLLQDQRSPIRRMADSWRMIGEREFNMVYETAYQVALVNAIYAVAICPEVLVIEHGEIEGWLAEHGISIRVIHAGDYRRTEERIVRHCIDEFDDFGLPPSPNELHMSGTMYKRIAAQNAFCPVEPVRKPAPSYLRHDPTKNTRRRRK